MLYPFYLTEYYFYLFFQVFFIPLSKLNILESGILFKLLLIKFLGVEKLKSEVSKSTVIFFIVYPMTIIINLL